MRISQGMLSPDTAVSNSPDLLAMPYRSTDCLRRSGATVR